MRREREEIGGLSSFWVDGAAIHTSGETGLASEADEPVVGSVESEGSVDRSFLEKKENTAI